VSRSLPETPPGLENTVPAARDASRLRGVKTKDTTAAEFARELEEQLDDYPEERAQLLTEAAEYWRRAGDDEAPRSTGDEPIKNRRRCGVFPDLAYGQAEHGQTDDSTSPGPGRRVNVGPHRACQNEPARMRVLVHGSLDRSKHGWLCLPLVEQYGLFQAYSAGASTNDPRALVPIFRIGLAELHTVS
jgi:hypothetical protein